MTVWVINGPNLNLLGFREPEIYGSETYKELCRKIKNRGKELKIKTKILQTNHEGKLVDWIQSAVGRADGIVLNPAAYTHTSIALRDALLSVKIPTVEVHLSKVSLREPFRQVNYIRDLCVNCVEGKGTDGYLEAMDDLVKAYDSNF